MPMARVCVGDVETAHQVGSQVRNLRLAPPLETVTSPDGSFAIASPGEAREADEIHSVAAAVVAAVLETAV